MPNLIKFERLAHHNQQQHNRLKYFLSAAIPFKELHFSSRLFERLHIHFKFDLIFVYSLGLEGNLVQLFVVSGKEESPPSHRSSPSISSVRYAQAQPIATSIRRGAAGASSPYRRPPSMPPLPPSSPSVPAQLSSIGGGANEVGVPTVGIPTGPHYASTTLTTESGMHDVEADGMGARTKSQPLETAM